MYSVILTWFGVGWLPFSLNKKVSSLNELIHSLPCSELKALLFSESKREVRHSTCLVELKFGMRGLVVENLNIREKGELLVFLFPLHVFVWFASLLP